MVFTLMVTSKGVAGVPRAVLVILLGTLDSFHLPAWPVLLILGIDQFMDMARTATNVLGNCLASAVVARLVGEPKSETPSPSVADAMRQQFHVSRKPKRLSCPTGDALPIALPLVN